MTSEGAKAALADLWEGLANQDAHIPEQSWAAALAGAPDADGVIEIANAAIEAGRLDVAGEALEPLAHQRHPVAMRRLAVLLDDQDPSAALAWFERAAEAGDAPAMNRLAAVLEDQDPAAALAWYECAAEAGNRDAMSNLGRLLAKAACAANDTDQSGDDAVAALFDPHDPHKARRWYERAAEAGDVDAMNDLGALLTDEDPRAAEVWFQRAADADYPIAMYNLGVVLQTSDPASARQWYQRAAEAGYVSAMSKLGFLLEEEDVAEALAWFVRAAEARDSDAMTRLGMLLQSAYPADAAVWYERGATAGNAAAMNNLGVLLREAERATMERHMLFSDDPRLAYVEELASVFDPHDPDKARRWYERAVDAGNLDAMSNLGVLLANSDPAAAVDWYERAAAAGSTAAMRNLGKFFVDEDPPQARRWFEKAIEAGDPEAAEYLKKMKWRGRGLMAGSVLVLLVCAGVSAVGFGLFTKTNYLAWYIANGTAVALVTGLVSLTIDLDRIPDLMSASPRRYVRACRMVVSLPARAWLPALLPADVRFTLPGDLGFRALDPGSSFSQTVTKTRPDGTKTIRSQRKVAGLYNVSSDTAEIPGLRGAVRNAPVTAAIIGVVMAAFFAWFIVLAPLQYITSAVLGAPVRRMRQRHVTVLYSATQQSIRMQRSVDPIPSTHSEVQFYRRPVTTTFAISSLVLWLVSLLL